ncbi:hypothetical protein BUALT_Bualt13G0015400 [Buddleja alternifolia]|uniref:Uncharacterized protein n=1 Tax=Buddleja alternifolia TaxID=168488 RepID=A0AAV6WSE4_9LAMI|nr:hypothetical protein BUALT_Bualt13G0015400 [Buddleja alternifolia]
MKIQPVDFTEPQSPPQPKYEAVAKPVLKQRFKRLFERQFLRTPAPPHKPVHNKDDVDEFEPSSICLAKMVQNFIEENNEKPQVKCGRRRCNCFNGNSTDNSDEDQDPYNFSYADACDVLKSFVPCLCVSERNLLADTAKIVEKNKISKRKDGLCRNIVTDGLIALGYTASICKSKWDKSPSFPAGEYEYVDVVIEGERFIIDIDFRSEFEIARSTKAYKLVLQTLPNVFVGKTDRLEKIIDIVSEAAKQSLKKKGMPFPPWRKAEYVKSKWLSPFARISSPIRISRNSPSSHGHDCETEAMTTKTNSCDGEIELIFGEKIDGGDGVKGAIPMAKRWEPPEIKPKSLNKGVKIVTGLASIIEDKS